MKRVAVWLTGVSVVEWILLLVGQCLVQRYSWLLDDAYIYFRYVDNAVLLGNGLVFNAGDFVEGFSSPAWCLLLMVLRLTGCPFWLGIRVLGGLFYAVVWLMLVEVNRCFGPDDAPVSTVNYPLIGISLTYGCVCYSTSGTESPLVIFMAVAFALLMAHPNAHGLQFVVGLAPAVRPELAIPWALVVGYLALSRRQMPWWLFVSGVSSSLGWLAFRIWYYADLLPNTFYLKDGLWFGQGIRHLLDTALPYHLMPVAGIFALLGWMFRRDARSGRRLILIMLALPIVLYVVKIGGDGRHFRYLLFPFVIATGASAGLIELAVARWGGSHRRAWSLSVLVCLASFTLVGFPRQLHIHPMVKPRIAVKSQDYRIHLGIHDAAIHRTKYTPAFAATGAEDEFIEEKRRYRAEGLAGDVVIVTPICRVAYRHWRDRVIHAYGLTDAVLSRTDVPSERPGHKRGLRPLAEDLAGVRRRFGWRPDAIRRALDSGRAPEWMESNREALVILERKVSNRHRLSENLWLSLMRIPPIVIERSGSAADRGGSS